MSSKAEIERKLKACQANRAKEQQLLDDYRAEIKQKDSIIEGLRIELKNCSVPDVMPSCLSDQQSKMNY